MWNLKVDPTGEDFELLGGEIDILVIDIFVTNPCTKTNLSTISSQNVTLAAAKHYSLHGPKKDRRKLVLDAFPSNPYSFLAFGMEVFGAMLPEAESLVKDLAA